MEKNNSQNKVGLFDEWAFGKKNYFLRHICLIWNISSRLYHGLFVENVHLFIHFELFIDEITLRSKYNRKKIARINS